MPRFLTGRVSFRLALLFLLASLIPIVGAGAIGLRLTEESVRGEAERRQRMLAELSGSLVEQYVETAQQKLATVSRLLAEELARRQVGRYAVENRDYRDAAAERLQGLVDPPDIFLEFQYFAGGAEPQLVTQQRQQEFDRVQRALPDYPARNVALIESNTLSDLVQAPFKEGEDWRAAQLSTIEGFTTLSTSVPVIEPEGTLGALAAYIDFTELRETLAAAAADSYAIAIVDAAGTELVRAGAVEGERISVTTDLGDSGWTVTVSESADEVNAAVARFRRQAWIWSGVAVLLAVLFSVFLSAWITRPIAELTRAAEEMEQGRLDARVGLDREDEIGRLGRAFDRMAAALAQLDEAKSEFVSNVSHELRTPLTSMKLSVANLMEQVVGPLEPRQVEVLERVRGEVDRMTVLVDELLEMARLEAGVIEPAREVVDLRAVADDASDAVRALASEAGVRIAVEGRGEAVGDPRMVLRVLVNLLDNAVKFSPRGGEVRVAVAPGELRVADEGPGIDPARIFEKFRQGDQDGVKHPGVGLGLAIVAKLVDLLDGSVRAESDNGAVFLVTLPRTEA